MPGRLFVFSAPSGSGKTSIVKQLLSTNPTLGFSISATTRKPRPGEVHGKDYYFLEKEDFENKVSLGQFAEYEEVYAGTSYGTLKEEIERLWSEGKDVLFDVDVVGGLNLKKEYGDKAVSIFVKVPDFETLKARLVGRGTETEESLNTRLEKVKYELTFEKDFDYVVINDVLSNAVNSAQEIINISI